MIGRSRLLCYISLLSGLWNVMIDTEIKISITYLVEQLTRLGDTSSCGSQSSWCCLQPKRCKSQGCSHPYLLPHRRPASPQTGGRGCVCTLVEAGQGWSRSRREGEGTTPRLIRSCHPSRPPPLALIKVDIIAISNIAQYYISLYLGWEIWWSI